LCENFPESIHHLFLHFHFSKEVWAVSTILLAHRRSWEGEDLINNLHTQIEKQLQAIKHWYWKSYGPFG